jgi:hypothetical protein
MRVVTLPPPFSGAACAVLILVVSGDLRAYPDPRENVDRPHQRT